MKIYIRQIPGTLTDEVYLLDSNENNDRHVYVQVGEDNILRSIAFSHREGEQSNAKPLFTCQNSFTREIIKAFLKLAKEENIHDTDQNYLQGKVEAMSEHLKDMRTLVFQENTIINKEI